MYDLNNMTLEEWSACGRALSQAGTGAISMEETARRIVSSLYENLGDEKKERACALVRLYKTHAYRHLPVSLMDYADAALGQAPANLLLKCLTLLGTVGDEALWNDRRRSVGHQAIPLVSEELVVSRIPMVARLVEQFGLSAQAVVDPDPTFILNRQQDRYDVFYVAEAEGSHYIPAQESFVKAYGIRSVLGFGGILPSGDLFAVILFSRTPISHATAAHFASLSLPVKIALLPFTFRNVFDSLE